MHHVAIDSIKFKGVSGVYRFIIGDYFYIGISGDIHKRMLQHVGAINKHLSNPFDAPTGSYKRVIDCISNSPEVDIKVEIIKECKHTHRSYERRYLLRNGWNPRCLNSHAYKRFEQ